MYRSLRILIVDDDSDDQVIIENTIRKKANNYRLSFDYAYSVDEAHRSLQIGNYDICLVDYHLGGLTGLDLLRSMKFLGCPTPIIFLTGNGNERIAAKAIQEGAKEYIPKSELQDADLAALIQRIIEENLRTIKNLRPKEYEELQSWYEDLILRMEVIKDDSEDEKPKVQAKPPNRKRAKWNPYYS